MAEHITRQRRITLTHGLVAWVWDDEEKLRERARVAVVAMREANQKPNPTSGSHDQAEKRSRDPWKISFEGLSRSLCQEDLVEFKRRIALFCQFVREEAASLKVDL